MLRSLYVNGLGSFYALGGPCAVLAATLALHGSAYAGAADSAPDATVMIDASQRLNTISPLLYGHFAEFMFENIKGGLWAEMLQNRGFERTAPLPSVAHYWERYPDNRNHDPALFFSGRDFGLPEEGYPTHFTNRGQLVVSTSDEGMRRGLYQAGIPVRNGAAYKGSVWLRAQSLRRDSQNGATARPFRGQVRLALEEDAAGGAAYAETALTEIPSDWKRFEFELPSTADDPRARFVIEVIGRGAVWLDQVSLLPSDALDGIRTDVFEKVQALRPAFIRWPGGNVAQDYHWAWGIGPRDQRPEWVNMSWADEAEPADFGTAEYIAFCRRLGAEPAIVVNVEGRGATLGEAERLRAEGKDIRRHSRPATAEEAANWVEYCNGPASSRFGALRAQHGHSAPYGVKYWEIGNEIWGEWVRGHSDADAYANNAQRYIRAMKAVDPSIKIIAVGDNDMDWNRTVLREIGGEIDFLAIHHYYGRDRSRSGRQNLMARPLWYERFYEELRGLMRELVPGREVKLAINEWNATFTGARQHSLEPALYAARLMNVFERQGDLVAMSAVSDLVNGWSGGIIQASRRRVFTTPTYEVIQAYSRHRGDHRLKCETVCSERYDPHDGTLGREVAALDVVASSGAGGRELYVKAVNTSLDRDLRTELEISGLNGSLSPEVEVLTVSGSALEDGNSFADPDHVTLETKSIASAGAKIEITFGKCSVTVIRFRLVGD